MVCYAIFCSGQFGSLDFRVRRSVFMRSDNIGNLWLNLAQRILLYISLAEVSVYLNKIQHFILSHSILNYIVIVIIYPKTVITNHLAVNGTNRLIASCFFSSGTFPDDRTVCSRDKTRNSVDN